MTCWNPIRGNRAGKRLDEVTLTFFGIQEELEMEPTGPENLSEKRHQPLLRNRSLDITKNGKNATKLPNLED